MTPATAPERQGRQRLGMMADDSGHANTARAAFERAQRLAPDCPHIAVANQHDLWRDKSVQQWLAGRSPPAGPVQLTLT